MKVFSVQQVTVIKSSDSPLELTVTGSGLASTTGWTNPRLDGAGDPAPGDAVIELSFEADRPTGPALQVLTPITATAVIRPTHGADAVVVSARTNSITIHASEFVTLPAPGPTPLPTPFPFPYPFPRPPFTTFIVGEEMWPTTFRFGEESPTTLMFGEEHGPWTDPRLDDPAGGRGNPFGSF